MSKVFIKIKWVEYNNNPIILPPFPSPIIADPFVFAPDQSPDNLWHLFAHSIMGIHHFISNDGYRWNNLGVVVFLGVRPYIYFENGIYYLFYEKLEGVLRFPFYSSKICVKTSTDLISWSQPTIVLTPSLAWHKTPPSVGSLGGPCVIKVSGKYILYYSAGLLKIHDLFFCEPVKPAIAISDRIMGPFKPARQSIRGKLDLSNLITTNRIYQDDLETYYCLQTYYFEDKNGGSSSALRLLESKDGLRWKTVIDPLIKPTSGWKKNYVYVGCLVKWKNKYRIYFNARDGKNFGIERIGLLIGS